MPNPFRITVLISGGGTTLKNLIDQRSSGQLDADIVQVISNNPDARGVGYATSAGIDTKIVDHRQHPDIEEFSELIFDSFRNVQSDLVVMGGFLRRVIVPADFVDRVVNIHPSLIPAFCGKGHYGRRVHEAVVEYGCKISGCTVHFVDDDYDHGPIIAQRAVPVLVEDTPETLARRIFSEECVLLPQAINWIAGGHVSVVGRKVTINSQDTI